MSYTTIQSHHQMFFDATRNDIYRKAIAQLIDKDSVVLDLGAGLGIHGFMAAQQGAKKVYLVEPERVLNTTKGLVERNIYSELMTCIQGRIEEVDLPEAVDVIVSVFTGNFLVSEDLLPSLFYARDTYLKPGGSLIPDSAQMIVAPVNMEKFYADHIDCWGTTDELDLNAVRQYAVNSVYSAETSFLQPKLLAEPTTLRTIDFMIATDASCDHGVDVDIKENSVCHGFLGWFSATLGDQVLSTGPLDEQLHWGQVFLPLDKPINVNAGEVVQFHLNRPDFGDWTWTITHNEEKQRQSAFLSEPRLPNAILKRSEQFQPKRNAKGDALLDVLAQLDGQKDAACLIDHLLERYPNEFRTRQSAKNFITSIAESYCD